MGSKVSLDLVAGSVCPQERVKESNKVFVLFFLETLLDVQQVLNAATLLFEHAVDQKESIGYKLGVTSNFLNNLKEQADVLLSSIFLYYDN